MYKKNLKILNFLRIPLEMILKISWPPSSILLNIPIWNRHIHVHCILLLLLTDDNWCCLFIVLMSVQSPSQVKCKIVLMSLFPKCQSYCRSFFSILNVLYRTRFIQSVKLNFVVHVSYTNFLFYIDLTTLYTYFENFT